MRLGDQYLHLGQHKEGGGCKRGGVDAVRLGDQDLHLGQHKEGGNVEICVTKGQRKSMELLEFAPGVARSSNTEIETHG